MGKREVKKIDVADPWPVVWIKLSKGGQPGPLGNNKTGSFDGHSIARLEIKAQLPKLLTQAMISYSVRRPSCTFTESKEQRFYRNTMLDASCGRPQFRGSSHQSPLQLESANRLARA